MDPGKLKEWFTSSERLKLRKYPGTTQLYHLGLIHEHVLTLSYIEMAPKAELCSPRFVLNPRDFAKPPLEAANQFRLHCKPQVWNRPASSILLKPNRETSSAPPDPYTSTRGMEWSFPPGLLAREGQSGQGLGRCGKHLLLASHSCCSPCGCWEWHRSTLPANLQDHQLQ